MNLFISNLLVRDTLVIFMLVKHRSRQVHFKNPPNHNNSKPLFFYVPFILLLASCHVYIY